MTHISKQRNEEKNKDVRKKQRCK